MITKEDKIMVYEHVKETKHKYINRLFARVYILGLGVHLVFALLVCHSIRNGIDKRILGVLFFIILASSIAFLKKGEQLRKQKIQVLEEALERYMENEIKRCVN